MSRGIVGLFIPIIVRVITIWDKVFFKLRAYFDVLVVRNKVFLESSHHIKINIYVVIEVPDVNSSDTFDLCLN